MTIQRTEKKRAFSSKCVPCTQESPSEQNIILVRNFDWAIRKTNVNSESNKRAK